MWWFYTVILGMAFAQILGEVAITMREWSRDRTHRPFLPAVLWQAFLLVLVVQVWLAVTYYRQNFVEITVAELGAFLAVPAGILIMSFLLPTGGEAGLDARTFGQVRPVFFGVLIAIVVVNLAHGFLIGEQGLDADLLFQGLILAGAVAGLVLRRPVPDALLAAGMVAVLLAYIGLEYSTVLVEG